MLAKKQNNKKKMNHTVSMLAVAPASQEENMGQDARVLGRGFPTGVGQALALEQ